MELDTRGVSLEFNGVCRACCDLDICPREVGFSCREIPWLDSLDEGFQATVLLSCIG